MQLEAGKKYTDRRGRVYGPMVQVSDGCHGVFGENRDDYGWYRDGRRSPGKDIQGDLVAEYVEPVKAAEPADNRVAPGEGYRLLTDDEITLATDEREYINDFESDWLLLPQAHERMVGVTVAKVREEWSGIVIRRKVEPPAPVETPDDLVIQDRVPARNGIDFGFFAPCVTDNPPHPWLFRNGVIATSRKHGDKMSWGDTLNVYCKRKDLPPIESPDDWVILDPVVYAEHVPRVGIDQFQGWKDEWVTQESFHSKQPIGLWHDATGGNHTRCRRKDLPPVPPQKPVEPEFPQYYVSDEWEQTAYIKRTNKVDSVRVMLDGRVQDAESPWHMHSASLFASGFLRLVTQAEAESRVKNTRTVVLKEWLCWDECDPESVTVDWFALDPSEEHGQFVAYDHAHETGNTRTVEIPVT